MTIIERFAERPQRLFWLDSAGAAFSAACLFAGAYFFGAYTQMPLLLLASIALAMSLFSAACAIFLRGHFSRFLVILAAVNSLYCLLTLTFSALHAGEMHWREMLYFIGESAIITALVAVEWRVGVNTK